MLLGEGRVQFLSELSKSTLQVLRPRNFAAEDGVDGGLLSFSARCEGKCMESRKAIISVFS